MRQQSDFDLSKRHFDKRVRILAEVVNQPDEIALVRAILQRNGWDARPADGQGALIVDAKRIALIFDIWLGGSRRFAVKAATKKVEELADQAKLGMWVRDAALVDYPRDTRKTYYIYNKLPLRRGWRSALESVRAWSSRIGTSRLIQVPDTTPENAVRAELARRDLGRPFDRSQHSLRPLADPGSGMPGPNPEQKLLAIGGLLAAFVGGAGIFWTSGSWRLLPLFVIVTASVPVALSLKYTRPAGWRRLGWGLFFSALLAMVGATSAGVGGVAGPRAWLGRGLLVGIGFLIAGGVVVAARGSWFGRNAAWVVPLTFTLLAPTVPWLGGAIFAEYLTQFGIPDTSVSVPAIWKILAAGGPTLISAGFVLLFIAAVGWLRYFHLLERALRWLVFTYTTAIVLIYALTALQTGLMNADTAAGRAMAAARNGHEPASYFGLQGTLVCLQPLRSPVPVLFGPLVNRPLLSFGANGDRLWAWDPGSVTAHYANAHVISVALQDVAVIQAAGHPAHCPPEKRQAAAHSSSLPPGQRRRVPAAHPATLIATAVCEALCGSIPIVTAAMTSLPRLQVMTVAGMPNSRALLGVRAWSENKTLAGRASASGGASAPPDWGLRVSRLRSGAGRCRG